MTNEELLAQSQNRPNRDPLPEQEPEAPVEQEEVAEQPEPQEQPEQPKESIQARNFRELKQQAERLARERDEAIRYAEEISKRKQPEPEPEEDLDFNLGQDDIAEGKHLSKVGKKIKRLEDQLARYEQQTKNAKIEQELRTEYADFDKVVSHENVKALALAYPEKARRLSQSNDLYLTGVALYAEIKKLGLDTTQDYTLEKEMIKKNMAKPRPGIANAQTGGDSPLDRSLNYADGDLTDEMKKRYYQELVAAKNRRQ